jgi:MerR family mercuric resistance operon transcriptional regulator
VSRPLRIGELAARAGVSVATLRFYERKGLLSAPGRNEDNNYRTYTDADLDAVATIKRLKALGFTLREIVRVAALRRAPHGKVVDLAKAKLAEVELERARVTQAEKLLRAAIAKPAELRALLLGAG